MSLPSVSSLYYFVYGFPKKIFGSCILLYFYKIIPMFFIFNNFIKDFALLFLPGFFDNRSSDPVLNIIPHLVPFPYCSDNRGGNPITFNFRVVVITYSNFSIVLYYRL